ncbi:FMN-binding protein [Microbacterium binotii]|uniref:FMN-binding domain-containing protein n=1 Tax=Microbacterium binotii TaxID=462710 RepID=A0ABP6BPR1_9MICO
MKKIFYGLMMTLSGLVLLMSWRTSWGEQITAADATAGSTGLTGQSSSSGSTATGSGSASGSSSATGSDSASGSGSASSATATRLADGTYTGDAVSTRYGNVQVSVTVAGGVITSVDVPQYPDSNGRDQQINARAIPTLVSETLDAQSAQIRMVSGATYTSQGYTRSLQSALDRAQS